MYYNFVSSYNNITYSIDMIRLKTNIDYITYSNLEFYLKTYYKDKIYKYWSSDMISQFKYNYNIQIEEGVSFWFGFHHNNDFEHSEISLHNFTIEFNPNKLKDNKLIKHILFISNNWYIKSYDLACDVKINIRDLIIDKGRKRKVQIYSNGGDDLTYRVGSGNTKIKVYNKKIESKLDIPYDLTRIEISRQLDDFPVKDVKFLKFGLEYFPEIFVNDYIYSISDLQNKTMLPIIYAVQYGFPINDLSRRYKEKIKKLFEGGHKLRFTDKDATEVLRKTIFCYFINNNIRWS